MDTNNTMYAASTSGARKTVVQHYKIQNRKYKSSVAMKTDKEATKERSIREF